MNRDSLSEYWRLIVEVWQKGVYGVDVGTIGTALLVLLVSLGIRKLFSKFVIRRLERLARKTQTEFDDRLIAALNGPLRFIPVTLGFFLGTEILEASGALAEMLTAINKSLIAFTFFWVFYRLVDPFSFILSGIRGVFTDAMVEWLLKSVKAAIMLLGGATILEIWGIQVMPIIAGLGILGVAVALGAQDVFRNLIGGLFVIGEKRFKINDWIRVENVVEGTVENIGFRTTKIRRFDKAPVYVPNAELSENAVTNFSQMTHRRIYWLLGVEYRTTVEQLRNIRDQIEAFILANDDFAHPPEVSTFVRIDRFSDNSIDIMLYCFTKTTVWGEWLAIKENLAFKVKEIVLANGTSFAFPSRTIYLESGNSDPEIFPLQADDT